MDGPVYAPRVSLVAQWVNNLPAIQEMRVRFLGREDPLEKEMAIHSGVLASRIPWTEEPGRLQSIGLQESNTTKPSLMPWGLIGGCLPHHPPLSTRPSLKQADVRAGHEQREKHPDPNLQHVRLWRHFKRACSV